MKAYSLFSKSLQQTLPDTYLLDHVLCVSSSEAEPVGVHVPDAFTVEERLVAVVGEFVPQCGGRIQHLNEQPPVTV